MLRRSSVADHITEVPLFAACNKREMQSLSRLTTEHEVPAGAVLTREGTIGKEFVVVLDGTAVVQRRGRKIATLGPGDYFGEIALLDPGERTATVTAETPMRLAVVSSADFAQLLDRVPALSKKILRALARQVRDLSRTPPL